MDSPDVLRREFLKGSALTAGAALAAAVAAGTEATATEQPQRPDAGRRKTILAIGAHMDDAEIGAGGVLIQAARAGHRVVVVTVVSDYRTWQPTIGREEATKRDLLALAQKFGYEKRFLDYPYHQIHGGDLELKRKLAEIYVELQPQVAFIHHVEDHWPDHVASGQAAHDALLFSHGLSHDRTERRARGSSPTTSRRARPTTSSRTFIRCHGGDARLHGAVGRHRFVPVRPAGGRGATARVPRRWKDADAAAEQPRPVAVRRLRAFRPAWRLPLRPGLSTVWGPRRGENLF